MKLWYRPKTTSLTVLAFSLMVFIWVLSGSFGACVAGSLSENLQKTIGALDGIIDLGLKLSTSLVGLAAALLIGLKGGLTLTAPVRTSLIISMLMFTQSAVYAVAWRFGIANSWLNTCLNLVTEPTMQRRYDAHLWFFIFGLISLGALVFVAAQSRGEEPTTKGDGP
jgi:hypothetical protein